LGRRPETEQGRNQGGKEGEEEKPEEEERF